MMLTPREIAERYRVSEDKIRAWIARGELRAFNVANRQGGRPRWRIHRADLELFEARRTPGRPVVRAPKRRPRGDVTQYF
jgi:excisionase family DNA binding protein